MYINNNVSYLNYHCGVFFQLESHTASPWTFVRAIKPCLFVCKHFRPNVHIIQFIQNAFNLVKVSDILTSCVLYPGNLRTTKCTVRAWTRIKTSLGSKQIKVINGCVYCSWCRTCMDMVCANDILSIELTS